MIATTQYSFNYIIHDQKPEINSGNIARCVGSNANRTAHSYLRFKWTPSISKKLILHKEEASKHGHAKQRRRWGETRSVGDVNVQRRRRVSLVTASLSRHDIRRFNVKAAKDTLGRPYTDCSSQMDVSAIAAKHPIPHSTRRRPRQQAFRPHIPFEVIKS